MLMDELLGKQLKYTNFSYRMVLAYLDQIRLRKIYLKFDALSFPFRIFKLLQMKQDRRSLKKRKALRQAKNSQDLFSNLTSPAPFCQWISNSSKLKPKVEDEEYRAKALMNLIHYANVMETFKKAISRFKGTNCPVEYKSEYNFNEKWQEKSKIKVVKNENVYMSAQGIFFIVAIIIMLHKIPMIWQLSVYRIFQMPESEQFFVIGLFFGMADLLLRIYLVYNEKIKNLSNEELSQNMFKFKILWEFVGDLITLVGYLIVLFLGKGGGNLVIALDLTVVFIQSKRFMEIYNSFLILLIGFKYRNTVNLFGFISKIFIILHICAIVVYSATLLNPSQNWLRSIGKNNADKTTQYIYSFYFSGTTMFTVGYGDVLPINNFQISVIMFIQVLGIVLTGYIISEIGHTLKVMRQTQDDFEEDIQNVDTICNNYNLRGELKDRVRNYIVNNRIANQELNVKQENSVLMKLNEDLRNEVNHVNNLNIIKSSLFFLCHWSTKLQMDVSKKLEKFLFSPNERITKLNKLYIVTNGKMDVYTERKVGGKVYCKKHLKSIAKDDKNTVFRNVFGSTSLSLAVAKDFAICYALDYADFMDILKGDEKDFQFYHQNKCKLLQEPFPEKFQVPDLINNRNHYCPSHYLILKRHRSEVNMKQQRKDLFRSQRKMKVLHVHEKQLIQSSDSEIQSSMNIIEDVDNNQADNHNGKKKGKRGTERKGRKISIQIQNQILEGQKGSILTYRSYRRKYMTRIDQEKAKEKEMKDLLQNSVVKTSLFEVGKSYTKYFKNGNSEKVLTKVNKNNFKMMKEVNSKNLQMDWIDLLIFAQKIHKGSR